MKTAAQHSPQHGANAAPQLHGERTAGKAQRLPSAPAGAPMVAGVASLAAAGNLAMQRWLAAGGIHAKLAVSQPGDPDELEADRVADAVVSGGSVPAIQRKCAACASGTPCGTCEDEPVQRKPEGAAGAHAAQGVAQASAAVRGGGGLPLPRGVQHDMEARLASDLGDVRVHADTAAASAAQAIQARAYTHGRDIAFAPGEYTPESQEGRRLLAHELVHVLQQSRATDGMAPPRINRQAKDGPSDNEEGAPIPLPAGVLPSSGVAERQPPPTGKETIAFEGVLLSTDADFVRWQLEQHIAMSGDRNTAGFVQRLIQSPAEDEKQLEASRKIEKESKEYPGDVSGAPLPATTIAETEHRIQNKELTGMVIQTVKVVHAKLAEENRQFIAGFESTALGRLRLMLAESKGRVEAEASQYGIPKEVIRKTGTIHLTAFPAPRTPSDIQRPGGGQEWDQEFERRQEAAAITPRRKLVEAAKVLQKKRNEVDSLRAKTPHASPGQLFPSAQSPLDILPLIQAEGEYAALRRQKEAEFPILASYAQEGGDLNVIIGAGQTLKQVLTDELIEKYDKIIATEGYIDDGKVTIWDVPVVIEGTRAQCKVDKDTMRWRIVQDAIQDIERAKKDQKEVRDAIGTVGMILGLIAAVPSAGASLTLVATTASVAIGAGMTVSNLQEYIVQSATSGTDFDRARAISQQEPSLFWIAVEILGTIADIHGAASTFQSLAGLRRAALVGEREAANALVVQGNRLGRQLGDRIAAEVAALQKSGKALREVSQVVDKEILQAGKLGEAAVHGLEQHEIIITKMGAFRCSKKCANIMWLYDDVLQRYPPLKPRLEDLAKQGAQGSKPLAAFTQRMDRLREIAAMSEEQLQVALKSNPPGTVLGDHVRFERYRRSGGLADYEDWFTQSRPQVVKSEEVWGHLSEELNLPLEKMSAKGLTRTQREQLLAEARAVDTAESVAGSYREKFRTIHPDFPGGSEWQVHHSIPQVFRDTLKKAGINVDSPSFLRGVRTTPGELSNAHQKITNYWQAWRRDFAESFGRTPNAAEILERAQLADWQFRHLYWEVERAAGIPVPVTR